MTTTDPASKINIVFFGTPQFSVPTLEALLHSTAVTVRAVVTQPDKAVGRGQKLKASPVKTLALEHSIPILQPLNIKKEETSFIKSLRALGDVDVGVVIAFGQILPLRLLETPRFGCINLHASLLPRWRGAAPIQRAILAGDCKTGVCLMQMDAGLDTGSVYSKLVVSIEQGETTETLSPKLSIAAAQLLLQDLGKIVSRDLAACPQDQEGLTYAHKIKEQEARIDWSKSNVEVDRQIRALVPSPCAFTIVGNKRLKILKATIRPEALDTPSFEACATPGTVLIKENKTLLVKCGYGELQLDEVQAEGKRRMPSDEFVRGARFAEHTILQ